VIFYCLHQDELSLEPSTTFLHVASLFTYDITNANEIVQLVPFSIHKIKSTFTEVVNCSHESIDHSDVEFHTLFAEIFTFAEKFQN